MPVIVSLRLHNSWSSDCRRSGGFQGCLRFLQTPAQSAAHKPNRRAAACGKESRGEMPWLNPSNPGKLSNADVQKIDLGAV